MNIEEFLKPESPVEPPVEPTEAAEPEELDVQKAVVESLAADKAEQDEKLREQDDKLRELRQELSVRDGQLRSQEAMMTSLKSEIAALRHQLSELAAKLHAELERQFDQQSRNPNALALLDREVELPDRFPGETRDHVIEALRAARESAEANGRVRCAQLLEGVLVANEPNGTLAERRRELEKLFVDNGNLINGQVINELNKRGISHKNGEEYLLPSEIIKRNY